MPSDSQAQSERLRRELVSRQRNALVPGEIVEKRLIAPNVNKEISHEEINKRYDRGEIRIVTETARYPLSTIPGLLADDNYKLDPDYQRRHRWNDVQKSRLVESFIMNVPVPAIFLYEYDYNKFEVMDGLQRLTAIREFYVNSFSLTGLEYWKELEGFTYSTLPSRIVDGINRRYLSSIILLRETSHGEESPETLKRFVFGRINTGGVQLSHQELRNALYDGKMNRLCKDLSRTRALRRLWGIPEDVEELAESPKIIVDTADEQLDLDLTSAGESVTIPRAWREMMDVELVLRFFANRQRMIAYRENIRDFLDAYLQAANDYDHHVIAQLEQIYVQTIELAESVFGERAFRRLRNGSWTSVPYVSIYDALMNVLSRLLGSAEELIANRAAIQEGLVEFYGDNDRVFNLRGQNRSDVMTREVKFEAYLRSFIGN